MANPACENVRARSVIAALVLTCDIAFGLKMNGERNRDRRDGNESLDVSISVGSLMLPQGYVGFGPFHCAGNLLKCWHGYQAFAFKSVQ